MGTDGPHNIWQSLFGVSTGVYAGGWAAAIALRRRMVYYRVLPKFGNFFDTFGETLSYPIDLDFDFMGIIFKLKEVII